MVLLEIRHFRRALVPCLAASLALPALAGGRLAGTAPKGRDAGRARPMPERAFLDRLAAEHVAAFRKGDFGVMNERFSPSFLELVPLVQLNAIAVSYQVQQGKVEGMRFSGVTATQGLFGKGTLVFHAQIAGGRRSVLQIGLGPERRITGWNIGPSFPATFEQVRSELASLGGDVSAFARVFGEEEARFALDEREPLAIGSTFKLWVLAELLRQIEAGRIRPETVARLQAENASLPSGQLQAWPPGAPVTAQTLATLMISVSDNTATDHLIDLVGRGEIERRLGRLYPSSVPERNIPFLKTRELFALQGGSEEADRLRKRYLEGDLEAKRSVLSGLAAKSVDRIVADLAPQAVFDRLEWFASTEDLVALMETLHGKALLEKAETRRLLREILSVNPGIADTEGAPRIRYLGYKGGSERGVLNLTQAIETESGRGMAVSLTWNRQDGAIDEDRLVFIFQGLRGALLDDLEASGKNR